MRNSQANPPTEGQTYHGSNQNDVTEPLAEPFPNNLTFIGERSRHVKITVPHTFIEGGRVQCSESYLLIQTDRHFTIRLTGRQNPHAHDDRKFTLTVTTLVKPRI